MDREPPRVTVTAPGSGGLPPDVLESTPVRSRRPRSTVVPVALAAAVLGAAVVSTRASAPPPASAAHDLPSATGLTASASLAGAPTDEPYTQRLTLTVVLPAVDGTGGSGEAARMLGDEAVLVEVRALGFTVRLDDVREVLPLGRFGVANRGRSTTVPATAYVDDCSVDRQARRDIVLTVRNGAGPQAAVRAVAEPDLVRALDRLVTRACGRLRG